MTNLPPDDYDTAAAVDDALSAVKARFDHADAPYDPDVLALIRAAEAMRATLYDGALPPAWADLFEALALLATHQNNDLSPFHCSHDQLTVMADPAAFTAEEIARLDALGFHVGDDSFYSWKYGSA